MITICIVIAALIFMLIGMIFMGVGVDEKSGGAIILGSCGIIISALFFSYAGYRSGYIDGKTEQPQVILHMNADILPERSK